jgi:hydrogenase maturation protease
MLVVIGCGNPNRSDDGAGVVVAQRLLALPLPPNAPVKIFDAGTSGMDILFQARGARKLIIIDASSSGSEPGAIFEVPGSELENRAAPTYTLHDFRWDHALYAGRRIWGDDFPADVTVFLIEAASLAYGLELTPAISQAVETVISRIAALIAQYCEMEAAP